MKPRAFVGSSVEALPVAYAVQKNLSRQAEVTVWDQGIFRLSRSSLESLIAALPSFDFALFIFSPDDILEIRGEKLSVTRDNVIFELGLFIGELGRNRCFMLAPENDGDALRFPTDLLGVEPAYYEADRSDNNWQAATGPACAEIGREFTDQGPRPLATGRAEGTSPAPTSTSTAASKLNATVHEDSRRAAQESAAVSWVGLFIEDKFVEAVDEINVAIANENDKEKALELKLARAFITFQQSAAGGEESYRQVAREHPDETKPWIRLSTTLFNSGFRDRALSVLKEALSLSPSDAGVIIAIAQCLDALQRPDEAMRLVKTALATPGPGQEELYRQSAKLHSQRGDNAEAFAILEQGLKSFPYDVGLLELKAELLLAASNHSASVLVYRQLIKLRPKEASYRALMGNALLELELYSLSLDAYRVADSIAESGQPWIIANIGNILSRRGFFGFAQEYLSKALAAEPQAEYNQDRLLTAKRLETAELQRLESLLKDATAPPPEKAPQAPSIPSETNEATTGASSPDQSRLPGAGEETDDT